MKTGYTSGIMKAAQCDEREAQLIENVMRTSHSCLDGLDLPSFNALARLSQKALKDPELRKLIEEEVFPVNHEKSRK